MTIGVIRVVSIAKHIETIFIIIIAVIAAINTIVGGFCTDMINVMKNVRSPNSVAAINDDDLMNEFQNVSIKLILVMLLLLFN